MTKEVRPDNRASIPFCTNTKGHVLIDGKDVQEVTLNSLRSQMGIMTQDNFLFTGTVMDNIRYGRLDATDEECIAAARAGLQNPLAVNDKNPVGLLNRRQSVCNDKRSPP